MIQSKPLQRHRMGTCLFKPLFPKHTALHLHTSGIQWQPRCLTPLGPSQILYSFPVLHNPSSSCTECQPGCHSFFQLIHRSHTLLPFGHNGNGRGRLYYYFLLLRIIMVVIISDCCCYYGCYYQSPTMVVIDYVLSWLLSSSLTAVIIMAAIINRQLLLLLLGLSLSSTDSTPIDADLYFCWRVGPQMMDMCPRPQSPNVWGTGVYAQAMCGEAGGGTGDAVGEARAPWDCCAYSGARGQSWAKPGQLWAGAASAWWDPAPAGVPCCHNFQGEAPLAHPTAAGAQLHAAAAPHLAR